MTKRASRVLTAIAIVASGSALLAAIVLGLAIVVANGEGNHPAAGWLVAFAVAYWMYAGAALYALNRAKGWQAYPDASGRLRVRHSAVVGAIGCLAFGVLLTLKLLYGTSLGSAQDRVTVAVVSLAGIACLTAGAVALRYVLMRERDPRSVG